MPISVCALNVYPVKGLKGIALTEARCTDRGIEHDRRWMVVDRDRQFISQREHPKMATVWTEIEGDALVLSAPDIGDVRLELRPEGRGSVRVQVWRSTCDAVSVSQVADEWLSSYLGLDCALVYMPEESKRFSNPEFGGEAKRVGFADGFAGSDKSPQGAAHRPTGLTMGPDGSLYLTDDKGGFVYRIIYR